MKAKKKTIAIQFDLKDVDRLKKIAKTEDRSVSAVIRTAVKNQYSDDKTTSGK